MARQYVVQDERDHLDQFDVSQNLQLGFGSLT